MTEELRCFQGAVVDRDSFFLERYRQAGLVIFGKTTIPEFGKSGVADTALWGTTRNP